MTLLEYQEKAMTTCMETCDNPLYMLFNLQGEVGELSSKIAKLIRKGYIRFDANNKMEFTAKAVAELTDSDVNAISDAINAEIGDVAWQLAGVCTAFGLSLEDICQANLDKLASRKQRGVIDGNGDAR